MAARVPSRPGWVAENDNNTILDDATRGPLRDRMCYLRHVRGLDWVTTTCVSGLSELKQSLDTACIAIEADD